MHDMVQEIYNLIHTPLVTPYNLLKNSKISNYNYVKYYKFNDGLVCEMECETPDGAEKYFYFFDANDHLQKIEKDSIYSKRELLFDRSVEVANKKIDFINKSKSKKIAF